MKRLPEQVTVKIMGREYAFVCEPDEKASLFECCELVDQKMSLIRAHGKLSAMDRIAVMASLSLAQELIATRAALVASEARVAAAQAMAAAAPAALPAGLTDDAGNGELDHAVAAVNERIEQFIAASAKPVILAPRAVDLFD
ncbi:cell division protein ZapA [Derxia lacustris]|uniref:cell division protein ZapA n=1 Tax=Derxia lacustris TaxID=764842 RepID=UPI000A170E67|nr:cell division protein ZapA [Derxia lacustris]